MGIKIRFFSLFHHTSNTILVPPKFSCIAFDRASKALQKRLCLRIRKGGPLGHTRQTIGSMRIRKRFFSFFNGASNRILVPPKLSSIAFDRACKALQNLLSFRISKGGPLGHTHETIRSVGMKIRFFSFLYHSSNTILVPREFSCIAFNRA